MSSSRVRPLRLSLSVPLAAACLLAAAGCSGSSSARVAVPRPPAAEAKVCGALHRALPKTMDGLARRTTTPASAYTAAWGSPAITLRCGVPRPAELTPGSRTYDPSADTVELNGVTWLPQQQPDGTVRCVTTMRAAWVEVTLPKKYTGSAGDISSLVDLAKAVGATVPASLD